ncbi:T9SS type A sorting domain-containing protein, partial [Candidatus Fermentibacteria bacterium]|nr:T9SS type A sorting domain-containing protein [Candidatus Fermentibacteria bacterium]
EIVSGTSGPFEPGTGVYSGTEGWRQVNLTMSSQYAGPRQLRWVFGSDASGNREGWYVDDVSVSAETGVGEEPGMGVHADLRAEVFPNPFSGSAEFSLYVPSSSGARIEIFDMAGRLVRELSYTGGAGDASVVWNGNDSSGKPVSPGMYLGRVSCGDRTEALRLIKL